VNCDCGSREGDAGQCAMNCYMLQIIKEIMKLLSDLYFDYKAQAMTNTLKQLGIVIDEM